jgi:hypothetical protein
MKSLRSEISRRLVAPLRSLYHVRQERLRFIRNLNPTDVFVVGHPKSGNTWLTLMLATIIEKNFSKRVTLANIQEFIPAIHAKDLDIELYADFPQPRFFRNEGPVYPDLYPKTIYIVRDPRAVYVSYYHHYLHDALREKPVDELYNLNEFIKILLTYGCLMDMEPDVIRWDRQVLDWLERSQRQEVKIVRYEDMQEDRHAVLKSVLQFVGIACQEEEIMNAVARGSFDSMRKEEETFGAEPYSGTRGERGFFVRKGKRDGWKEELLPELAMKIEEEFSLAMKKLEYL